MQIRTNEIIQLKIKRLTYKEVTLIDFKSDADLGVGVNINVLKFGIS